jgi:hypothetical protein
MAFVVKYSLGNRPLAPDTRLARYTLYGLFTLSFFVLFAFDGAAVGKTASTDTGVRLPTHLNPLLAEMKASCRNHIVNKLQAAAQAREKPPPFAEFVRELRRTPTSPLRGSARDKRARLDPASQKVMEDKYREYVAELEERYGALKCSQVAREL